MAAFTSQRREETKACPLVSQNTPQRFDLGTIGKLFYSPNYVMYQMTKEEIRSIRIENGHGYSYKVRYKKLLERKCPKRNTQIGQIAKNVQPFSAGFRTHQNTLLFGTPPSQTFAVAGSANMGCLLTSNKGVVSVVPRTLMGTSAHITNSTGACSGTSAGAGITVGIPSAVKDNKNITTSEYGQMKIA